MMKHPLTLSALALLVCASAQAATVDLRVLETTDLHSNMMDFDYYKDTPTDKFGLVRTASLIQQARQQAANAVLVDNGDIIQGSPLGDYMARAVAALRPDSSTGTKLPPNRASHPGSGARRARMRNSASACWRPGASPRTSTPSPSAPPSSWPRP